LKPINKSLENGEDLLISRFGKFSVKDKNEQRGRNPQTGEDMMLSSGKVVVFRCSDVLRDKVNGKG
jgi:integration host factor subunit alpha